MARDLGLHWQTATVDQIVAFCVAQIRTWLGCGPPVRTVQEIQHVVCSELGLVFEEVWSVDDLRRVVSKYVDLGEFVFAVMPDQLDDATYATLVELQRANQAEHGRYVAVIDCRDDKGARRFFTKWHEVAHLLTLRRALEAPCHRSSPERDPIERLMDAIAAEIGFYEPLFRPLLEQSIREDDALTLDGVARVRTAFCPEASFQATLIASVKRAPLPAIYVEAGLGYKKSERAEIESEQMTLFAVDPPLPKLRAQVVQTNQLARASGLRIDQNMEIPPDSVIARVFADDTTCPGRMVGTERLGDWQHADGTSLADADVRVEALKVRDRVWALISAEDTRSRPVRL